MQGLRGMISHYLQAGWQRRWYGVAVAWLVCCAGWTGVHFIPNQYESSARLYVDADAVLTPLLHGLAADSSPTSQLEILQRTLLSRPNLEKLVSKTDLDLTVTGGQARDRLIARLANEIKVSPQTRNLFTITYRGPTPNITFDVVQALLTIFIESATGTNRTDMDNARRFLEHQIASYEEQLRAAEKRRADFRARYIEVLPTEGSPDVSGLDAARSTASLLEGRLQDALTTRNALKKELASTPPLLVIESGQVAANGQPIAVPKTRLEEAQDQLNVLLLRDTENHPDVIAQRKLIESLKGAPAEPRKSGTMAASTATSGGVKRSTPNQVYDQLKVKLIDAETQIMSLQRQVDEAVKTRDRLEKTQREQPGLQAEYTNMDRDYSVLRRNYDELLSRLQSANIAQAADTQADKVKLQIIDPPQMPRQPVAPNRMLLLTGVLLGGLGAGVASTVLLIQFDSSFKTLDDLRALGLPVLGGVSVLQLVPLRRQLLKIGGFASALGMLVAIYCGLLVHLLRSSVQI